MKVNAIVSQTGRKAVWRLNFAVTATFKTVFGREKSVMEMQTQRWYPNAGRLATYVGQTRSATRNVRVLAEARKGRMLVEAIGRKGRPVRFTVLRDNLIQPQPDLFII